MPAVVAFGMVVFLNYTQSIVRRQPGQVVWSKEVRQMKPCFGGVTFNAEIFTFASWSFLGKVFFFINVDYMNSPLLSLAGEAMPWSGCSALKCDGPSLPVRGKG